MRSLLAGLVCISLCAPLHAQAPKGDEALLKTVQNVLDGIKQETLPNGLRVYLLPIPNSPTVTTMVGYKVGSCDEELDQTGLSHYLEHLMFKGTDKLNPGDIDRATQRNGGRNNAYTTEDMTNFHFDFAADRWMQALEIEADRMRNLRIDAKHEFEQEKGAVIAELDGNEDGPWELEGKAILPLLFGAKTPNGHPVIGEKAHVRNVSAETIKKHYDRWYHPNNAVLVVVGGFDPAAAMAKIKELFGPIPAAKLPDRKPAPERQVRAKPVRKKFESKFDTPKLMAGFNTCVYGDPDDFVLDVLSHALTEGKLCRIFKQMVEADELASTVESFNTTTRYPGWFEIRMELVDEKDFAKAERKLQKILADIAKTGLAPVELARAKRSFLAGYVFALEDNHDLADVIAKTVLDKDLDFLKTVLPRLLAVTNEDVKRVADKYFVKGKPIFIESAPAKKAGRLIAPQADGSRSEASLHHHQITTSLRSVSARGASRLLASNSPLPDFSKVQKHTLPNGLRVVLMENHRLPIVCMDALVRDVGMRETADQHGIAALLGAMLEEGTTKRTADQIAATFESRGATQHMGVSGGAMKALAVDLKVGIDVFFDCLSSPAFPAIELESQREVLLSRILEDESKAKALARLALYERAYAGHPFSRAGAGTADAVKAIKAEDLRKFHAEVFVPNNTIIVLVGDFDSKQALGWIEAATKGWKPGKLAKLPKAVVEKPEKAIELFVSDPTASQLHVYLGHAGVAITHPDYFKLLVMDNVLGTGPGFTDRLSASLRDRQGLAYEVNATITATMSEQPGLFLGYIGTFPDKYAEVKEGVLKEIKDLRAKAPSRDEVENAKKYLVGSLPFSFGTNQGVADKLLMMERHDLGADYFECFRKGIEAVTPEEVREAARTHIDPDRLIFVAVGPVDAAGKPLKGR